MLGDVPDADDFNALCRYAIGDHIGRHVQKLAGTGDQPQPPSQGHCLKA